jgi:hypothetical protein
MLKQKGFTLSLAIMAFCTVSPAAAQTLEAYGPVLPMQFDRYGARHFYVYGYYGPFAPPMPSPVLKAMRDRSERRSHASSTAAKPKARIVRQ